MNPILTALRAIEARAERAIDHELQTMMQDILALRTSLVLGERSEADSLLLKLDRLISINAKLRPTDSEPTLLEDIPRAMECTPSPALVYQTSFFDPQFGSLEDVVAAHCFAGAVQTAIGRLPEGIDCTVDATWSHGRGRLEVQTLEGIVIASVQAAPSPVLAIHPSIASACQALQSGETVLSQAQFAHALMQRAAL